MWPLNLNGRVVMAGWLASPSIATIMSSRFMDGLGLLCSMAQTLLWGLDAEPLRNHASR